MNPGDTPYSYSWTESGDGTLNEGRGVNPGDTSYPTTSYGEGLADAQRRPGREPRRHTR